MGRMLSQRGNKYRLWSTISDSYLTKWLTRDEMVDCLARKMILDVHRNIEDLKKNFPADFVNKETKKIYWPDEAEKEGEGNDQE